MVVTLCNLHLTRLLICDNLDEKYNRFEIAASLFELGEALLKMWAIDHECRYSSKVDSISSASLASSACISIELPIFKLSGRGRDDCYTPQRLQSIALHAPGVWIDRERG